MSSVQYHPLLKSKLSFVLNGTGKNRPNLFIDILGTVEFGSARTRVAGDHFFGLARGDTGTPRAQSPKFEMTKLP